jgi:hypothetical protein
MVVMKFVHIWSLLPVSFLFGLFFSSFAPPFLFLFSIVTLLPFFFFTLQLKTEVVYPIKVKVRTFSKKNLDIISWKEKSNYHSFSIDLESEQKGTNGIGRKITHRLNYRMKWEEGGIHV